MKKLNLPFAMTILSLSLVACSNGGGGGGGPVVPGNVVTPPVVDVSGTFTYEFKVNGCTTGKQIFSSKKAYCDSLLNDSLNQNCAREMRVETYNRNCTNTPVANVGNLPAMSAARCVVNGMDLKDRTFLDNLNPFNPQRRQTFRDMFWDGKRNQGYDILGSLLDSYGRARLNLTPAAGQAAQGEIQLLQRKGDDYFAVRSGLGSKIRMLVTNFQMEKEVEAVCISDTSFKRAKVNVTQVRCSLKFGSRKQNQREEMISWNAQSLVEKELFRNRANESVIVRLKPATGGQDERIEIEAAELDIDKTLRAESTLNEGLEVRYQGRSSGTSLNVSCAPASK
ncbi:hypothetical protein QJS83_10005 [Bdellovibrio sp. 22V]|uniref:hypothetical protein n=1 Tax=Bdellovibrio TaxID=958 RepID=UPI0025436853|nr:hypothetical protein [Bdellovibrio sp. 22V]WII70793.1 hypothetical protein QJS83_10005 [Bdellovibrio sp. 22V]